MRILYDSVDLPDCDQRNEDEARVGVAVRGQPVLIACVNTVKANKRLRVDESTNETATQLSVPSTASSVDFVKIAFSDTNALDATPNSVPSNEKLTSPSVPI